ncbi:MULTISPECIES: hypothetical protein [unclassified Aeromicrobium]|uniref:hypothetical protein n=1 Tax=unclassified Aeromicrobium TaxID=2633570 RepID=UPI002889B7DA|nr:MULTISPECIES: hypothetical protein [unclassified Aeromicrobium]
MSGVRRLVPALLTGAVLVLVGACSGGPDSSENPAAAVETMMRALDAGDCQAVKDVVLTPSEIDCGFVTEIGGMFADEGLELDDVDFTVAESSGDQATVEIDWNDGDPRESYEVQRVDGAWKVLFDSAA